MSSPDTKRRALGRGLDALLPAPPAGAPSYGDKSVFACPLEKIVPQKGQPRQRFDAQKLEELAAEHPRARPHRAAGRAARGRRATSSSSSPASGGGARCSGRALREALVVVKDVSAEDAFELALIENVQREDLNAIELAEAYDRLVRDHGYTQEALADRVGKDRTTIANVLRLLKLPPRVRARVVASQLSEGHARALLGAGDAAAIEQLAERVVRGGLSVRATEALVRAHGKAAPGSQGPRARARACEISSSASRARSGHEVEVRDRGNKGEVAIPYADLDALDRLIDKLL